MTPTPERRAKTSVLQAIKEAEQRSHTPTLTLLHGKSSSFSTSKMEEVSLEQLPVLLSNLEKPSIKPLSGNGRRHRFYSWFGALLLRSLGRHL
jgi:hypothetical protein